MKTQSVSSYMLSNSTRNIIARAQADLVRASQEATSGVVFDKGLTLGSRAGQSISLRKEHDRLTVLTETNGLISERMKASQNALTNVIKGSQDFLGNVTAMRGASEGRSILVDKAKGLLQTATDLVNTSYNGEYVFAGENTDVKPLGDYGSAGDPARAAILKSFQDRFGFATTDPQVATISAADMTTYLNTSFAAEFDAGSWSNWSSASDTLVKSRIAPTELAETSVSANNAGFRQLAMSYTMMAELGDIGLNQAAFDAVIDKVAETTNRNSTLLAGAQSFLGNAQARTKDATDRLTVQINVLKSSVLDLEAVDPYEAASRVEALRTQIDASYALTVRIQSLSLLNHLK
ncbi:flagellar hook-associated family protein [Phyllobacterium endophyticum]|uniref:Flagellin n=1 Tax=Phyllobacterium endophyticum TaxID=1149773 RepID=A0A2P7AP14_9HYPH|nr:flagellar hook-associated family protein [Phyllobacterium endophyticum]MBB3233703.1 flagellar hook-associated protein 3 FlgL [Phyllobacterium endophyticum]PSH55951.1 flagellar biosynthesis protein FlgL [Phyllobacterium endophyticum]TXR47192.1 flagellar hook-associated family protein [Phyllobacterium endophyticum]TYR41095.1 flagellar hook-associated family protein [Phyllobacterium endophyticum]